jgi:hypothetical protein
MEHFSESVLRKKGWKSSAVRSPVAEGGIELPEEVRGFDQS